MTDRNPSPQRGQCPPAQGGRLGRVAQFVKRLFDPPALTRIPSYNEIHDSWSWTLDEEYQG